MHAELNPTHATEKYRAYFWSRVEQSPDDCWRWKGPYTKLGYGKVSWRNATRFAHRVAYALAHGVDPGALLVCHHCDNPPCCNPAHLFLGTNRDNSRDMAAKGRAPAPRQRLTEDEVRAVRAAVEAGEAKRAIARRFGITHKHVSNLALRKQRAEVT